MARSPEDVRNHLMAVMAAAQELPPDEREFLAQGFLDELLREYQLVPRGAGSSSRALPHPNGGVWAPDWLPALAPFLAIGAVLGMALLIPTLFFFALIGPPGHHFFFPFLPLLLLFLAFRFFGPWRYRRHWRMMR